MFISDFFQKRTAGFVWIVRMRSAIYDYCHARGIEARIQLRKRAKRLKKTQMKDQLQRDEVIR